MNPLDTFNDDVRRIANLINYGAAIEDVRQRFASLSEAEFFHLYKAAEVYTRHCAQEGDPA